MNGGLLANKLINNGEFNRAPSAAQTRCSQTKDSEEPTNAKRHYYDAQRRVEPRGARTEQETMRCLTASASNAKLGFFR